MKLAAVGSNCIDFYLNLNGGTPFPGGGPVNMAVYTVRIGGQSTYIGHVGDDANGKVMRNAIEAKGVDTSHLYTKPGRTAVTQVEIVDGERVFGDYDEGVLSDYCLTNEDIEFIKNYDVVVCDLWGKVEGQFKDLKAAGITTAFDGADRPDDPECQTAMPYTDYLFFSTENGDTPELRAQMQRYAARGPKLVIAMLGSEGSLCWDGKEFHKFGIIPCEALADTMGAGDSYIAGFLYGITEGFSIEQAMEKGARTATDTLKYSGAW